MLGRLHFRLALLGKRSFCLVLGELLRQLLHASVVLPWLVLNPGLGALFDLHCYDILHGLFHRLLVQLRVLWLPLLKLQDFRVFLCEFVLKAFELGSHVVQLEGCLVVVALGLRRFRLVFTYLRGLTLSHRARRRRFWQPVAVGLVELHGTVTCLILAAKENLSGLACPFVAR